MPPFRERERERRHNKDCEQVVAWWWGLTVVFHPHSNPTVTAVVEWGGVGGVQVEVMDFTCTAARVSSWPVLGVKGYKCRECSLVPLTTGAQVTRAALPESRQRSDFARNFRMCSAIPA